MSKTIWNRVIETKYCLRTGQPLIHINQLLIRNNLLIYIIHIGRPIVF